MKNLEQQLKDLFSTYGEAVYNYNKGLESGKYVAPINTTHINYKAGERFNRMNDYIDDLLTAIESKKEEIENQPVVHSNYFGFQKN